MEGRVVGADRLSEAWWVNPKASEDGRAVVPMISSKGAVSSLKSSRKSQASPHLGSMRRTMSGPPGWTSRGPQADANSDQADARS